MILAAALLLFAPILPPSKEVAAAWFAMNAATLETSAPGSDASTRCEFELPPEGGVRVRVTSVERGQPVRREMILVGDTLLARDAPLPAGRELEIVDACRLNLQLAGTLLSYGVGVPPLSIRGRDDVGIFDATIPIQLTGASVRADVPTPWSLRGWAESGTTGIVTFDLVHTTPAGDARLVGTWERRATPPSLPDAMPLSGWSVYRIEKGAAIPSRRTFPTLGALRASSEAP